MAIRSDKIGQSWLLPLAVSELIPEDHICNLVEVVVDNMDVGEIEQKYSSGPGNPCIFTADVAKNSDNGVC